MEYAVIVVGKAGAAGLVSGAAFGRIAGRNAAASAIASQVQRDFA